jgi:hypothetical protein
MAHDEELARLMNPAALFTRGASAPFALNACSYRPPSQTATPGGELCGLEHYRKLSLGLSPDSASQPEERFP